MNLSNKQFVLLSLGTQLFAIILTFYLYKQYGSLSLYYSIPICLILFTILFYYADLKTKDAIGSLFGLVGTNILISSLLIISSEIYVFMTTKELLEYFLPIIAVLTYYISIMIAGSIKNKK